MTSHNEELKFFREQLKQVCEYSRLGMCPSCGLTPEGLDKFTATHNEDNRPEAILDRIQEKWRDTDLSIEIHPGVAQKVIANLDRYTQTLEVKAGEIDGLDKLINSLLKEDREKCKNFLHVPLSNKCEHGGYNFGCALCLDAIVENKIAKRVGMLRQWLNEERITDPQKMVTNEDLLYWLTPDTNQTEV